MPQTCESGIIANLLFHGWTIISKSFFWRKLIINSGLGRHFPSLKPWVEDKSKTLKLASDRLLAFPIHSTTLNGIHQTAARPGAINLAIPYPTCPGLDHFPRNLRISGTPSPWGENSVVDALTHHYHLAEGLTKVVDQRLLVTHGGSGAWAAILDSFINPGDKVACLAPTSPLFTIGLEHRRAQIAWLPATIDQGQMRLDTNLIAQGLLGAKMLVVCDPHNPTGATIAGETWEQLAYWAQKNNTIIVREASDLTWLDGSPRYSPLLLPHAQGRMLSFGSLGRSHGLTAARVGWVIGPKNLAECVVATQLMQAPFVPLLCQTVAQQAVETRAKVLTDLNWQRIERRNIAYAKLVEMGLNPHVTGHGHFIWVPIPKGFEPATFCERLYSEQGVLTTPGHLFGQFPGQFRLSIATDLGRLQEGLSRFAQFLRQPQNQDPKVKDAPINQTITL